MKLSFLGAARQVTGSRYCLKAGGANLLVDCGMFQERPYLSRNWGRCPIESRSIDAVLLTHAHLDHCGLLPRLVAEGFKGPIHTTEPTVELAQIVLEDAAKIQVEDAAYKARRHRKEGRRGPHPEEPLFDADDARRAIALLRGHRYNQPVHVAPGITAEFHDAGHIIGSSMVLLRIEENGKTHRVLFSGDIGQIDKPFVGDPSIFEHADYVVMESTYGGKNHPRNGGIEDQLADVITRTLKRGGNVVIPTFAIERAQELMWHIGNLVRSGRLRHVDVFLDSPMARDVTEVYDRYLDWLDADTARLIKSGQAPLEFAGFRMVQTQAQSMAINNWPEPCVIMASSGMCTGGRVKHHLRFNLPRPQSTVLFVGYQAEHTLGRQILDGHPEVRIHGRTWPVRCEVASITGFSAHADHDGLMRWASHFRNPPKQAFLTHGEGPEAQALADALRQAYGWNATVPSYMQEFDLG